MSKLPIFNSKLKWFFKPKLKPKLFLLNCHPAVLPNRLGQDERRQRRHRRLPHGRQGGRARLPARGRRGALRDGSAPSGSVFSCGISNNVSEE